MIKRLYTLCCLSLTLCLPSLSQAQLTINTFAGNGTPGYGGDMGPATAAQINNPNGVAVDHIGNVYIADYGNNRIRKIDTFGVITTIAGTGVSGFSGDGGPATLAKINQPKGIVVDAAGNVFFSDYNRIRKINTAGIISTITGSGFATYSGDGGPATAAEVNFSWGMAFDAAGNLFIADQFNCRVRKINTAGIMSTVTGNGICFGGGDGGPATAALVQYPLGVACDATGNVYIADYGNNRIRKINSSGIISTIAGSTTFGFTGDGGPSTAARLYYPEAVATDALGNIYICDINNSRIRVINPAGIINTITGTGTDGFSGDGGPPLLAQINRSTGVAVGPGGKIYICDDVNNRIRIIYTPSHAPYFIHGHVQHFVACPIETIDMDSLLTIYDVDTGQTETWSVISGPSHGALATSYSTTSTGSIITPSGFGYSSLGYIGSDTITVRVTDGIYSDTTTIYFTILPSPDAGTITGLDSICPGDTVTFADTSAGGTWGSSDSTVATITGSGLVTGLVPGSNIVTYTVTNPCGTAIASFPFIVRSDCPAAKVAPVSTRAAKVIIFPNPNQGLVTVTLLANETEETEFIVTNMVGEVVKEFKAFTNKPVDILLNVPGGIYFLSAINASGKYMEKMTVAK